MKNFRALNYVLLTIRISMVVTLISFLFFSHLALAAGPISAITTPNAPGPDMPTTIRLQSYIVDVRASFIVWVVNGERVQEGVGSVEYKFTTGSLGSESRIEALITAPDGATSKESVTIRPALVDILWQADTFVPPFYKGKAMPTHGSAIRAVALPQFGQSADVSKTAFFKWSRDLSRGLGEGTGLSMVNTDATWARATMQLGVEVRSQDGSYKAARAVPILSAEPQVQFYEDSPVFGVRFEKALSGIVKSSEAEFHLHAVPYFFSSTDRLYNKLLYKWYVDNQLVRTAGGINDDITILNTETGSKDHRVLLVLQNSAHVTQKTGGDVGISFSE
jgi:hypothetical protein